MYFWLEAKPTKTYFTPLLNLQHCASNIYFGPIKIYIKNRIQHAVILKTIKHPVQSVFPLGS